MSTELNIAEKCGWNLDCISNSIAAVILAFLRGSAPQDLVRSSAFRDEAECTNSECRLRLNLTEDLVAKLLSEYGQVFADAYRTLLRFISPEELVKFLQFVIDHELDQLAEQIHANTDLSKLEAPVSLRAQVAEQIATMLYALERYSEAKSRFEEASRLYREANLPERALFMEAFAKITEAELLKEQATRLHEENRHNEEEELIKRVSKIYAETSILFRQASRTIPEALVNAVLSKCDANEVLANFYFTHGQVEEAEKYYTLCYTELRQEYVGVAEEYRKLIEFKERTCRAFAKLCRAVIESKSQLYEEAGDEFRKLVQEGYIEDVMVEMATIAYRSAIETAETLDDILRVYPKYIDLVTLYIDRRVAEKFGDFSTLLSELKVRPISAIARDIRVDEYAFKIYLASKILREVAEKENIPQAVVLDLLTLVAGLGLDPLSVTSAELREEISKKELEVNTELLNQMCRLLDRLNERVREIILY